MLGFSLTIHIILENIPYETLCEKHDRKLIMQGMVEISWFLSIDHHGWPTSRLLVVKLVYWCIYVWLVKLQRGWEWSVQWSMKIANMQCISRRMHTMPLLPYCVVVWWRLILLICFRFTSVALGKSYDLYEMHPPAQLTLDPVQFSDQH